MLSRIRWDKEFRVRYSSVFYRILLITGVAICLIAILSGCTTLSTEIAIQNYKRSEKYKQDAFDRIYNAVQQQLYLSTSQYISNNQHDAEKTNNALRASFKARHQLEKLKLQYERARSLSEVTVGQYLYDQQGAGNVLVESLSYELNKTSKGINEANAATGVKGIEDVIPKEILDKINERRER